jgi:hypothetical protein
VNDKSREDIEGKKERKGIKDDSEIGLLWRSFSTLRAGSMGSGPAEARIATTILFNVVSVCVCSVQ